MRIFLGTEEIASILGGLNEGFKRLGYTTTTYVSQKNKYYNWKYNIEKGTPINNLISYKEKNYPSFIKYLALKVDARLTPGWVDRQTKSLINDHDVFIFVWQPWLPEWKLFEKIKSAGKKIICLQLGSDVRDPIAFQQEFNIAVDNWEDHYFEKLNYRLKKIRYQELFADIIYSVPDQAGLLIRPYKHVCIPLARKKEIPFAIHLRKIPIIVHAPTNSNIKGTDTILRVLDQLKNAGIEFELRLLQNLPNEKLMTELANADILVDELVLHGPGVLSFEAMKAGCAVATRIMNRHKEVFDPPVCGITEENIFSKLKLLIQDISYREDLTRKAKFFADKFSEASVVAANLINDLNGYIPDYYPEFYLSKYEFPNEQKMSKENMKLSKQVVLKHGFSPYYTVQRAIKESLLAPLSEQEQREYEARIQLNEKAS